MLLEQEGAREATVIGKGGDCSESGPQEDALLVQKKGQQRGIRRKERTNEISKAGKNEGRKERNKERSEVGRNMLCLFVLFPCALVIACWCCSGAHLS